MNNSNPLSTTLRALRETAGISGSEAARRAGLSQSKVSRAETGRFAPSPEEVRALCEVYQAPARVRRELVQMASDLKEVSHSARMTLQRGGWWMQERIGRIEQSAARILEIAPSVVIGLVQTRPYIEALFGDALPDSDRERTVQARLDRQRILGSDREIVIVMTEGALRWNMGGPSVMVGQLEHLVDVSSRPNVRLGLIPWTTSARVPLLHPFAMYDNRAVLIGTQNATAIITDQRNIADYEAHWKEIEPLVSWDYAARSEIQRIRLEYVDLAQKECR